jgi:hypothetical protein
MNKTDLDVNIAANLRETVLHEKPLWRDILTCKGLGFSEPMTARTCGCKLTTLRKHLHRMAECGFALEGVQ